MRFTTRKQRQAPAVIIISLIDILIVLLIFLMVTTTFKQFPAVKLNLPEVRTPKEGATQNSQTLVVTVTKEMPHFHLGPTVVTLTKLQQAFIDAGAKGTNSSVAIRADKDASVDNMLKVVQAAYAANLKPQISIFVQQPGGGAQ